ncbi:MAG: alpha-1,4-glucan--maltose-1-phosphate maltosyltransferase [Leptospirales bacterium]
MPKKAPSRLLRPWKEIEPLSRKRVRIERISPSYDGGRFPVKRIPGEMLPVELHAFADGHEPLFVLLEFLEPGRKDWFPLRMEDLESDRWTASFSFSRTGIGYYRVSAWVDEIAYWQEGLRKKHDAGMTGDLPTELLEGEALIRRCAGRATDDEDSRLLLDWSDRIRDGKSLEIRIAHALDPRSAALAARFPDPRFVTGPETLFPVHVERTLALKGSWYEFFPRSSSRDEGRHGTLEDARKRLPEIAEMGFDVVYLPPVHPIGHAFRKGPNNTPDAGPDVPGSPWAIGAGEGGHTAIDSRLGTMEDFRKLVEEARSLDLEVAMDLAFQCSPDHPYVQAHPEWFRHRPDGSIHYAENPPKKYQDIYPLDFLSDDWKGLWEELRSVVLFWVEKGVRIFRVDNPHTKPFPFWEWLLAEIRSVEPDTVFLAEAFTRPDVMYHLARIGFSQSYTYFTWRTTKQEIEEYLTEITSQAVRDFFRPNLWPNTPDILHEFLQKGGRPAFLIRLALAATLSASYGIYGPPFEWCENKPIREGSEEYLNSEKYEIRYWHPEPGDSLRPVITRLNRIRKEFPELGWNHNLVFHPVDNDQLIAYSKQGEGKDDWILTVVNLDPFNLQMGWLTFSAEEGGEFEVEDLMNGARYTWSGDRHFVQLDPGSPDALPFHLFRRVP